jgi:hypothetical protein
MCPTCKSQGIEFVISEPSIEESKGGDSWFNVAYCSSCGHIHGIFNKVSNPPTRTVPNFGS